MDDRAGAQSQLLEESPNEHGNSRRFTQSACFNIDLNHQKADGKPIRPKPAELIISQKEQTLNLPGL